MIGSGVLVRFEFYPEKLGVGACSSALKFGDNHIAPPREVCHDDPTVGGTQ